MNDQSSSNNTAQANTPGGLLKAARELRGWEQSTVAEKMRLSLQTIIDIESDDYARFSAEIYLRGHIRNYARLLDVDAKMIFECYESMGFEFDTDSREKLLSAQAAPVMSHAVRPKKLHGLLWGSLAVGLILIVMVVLWWHEQETQHPAVLSNLSTGTDTLNIHIATKTVSPVFHVVKKHKAAKVKRVHHAKKVAPKKQFDDYSHFVPDYKIESVKR